MSDDRARYFYASFGDLGLADQCVAELRTEGLASPVPEASHEGWTALEARAVDAGDGGLKQRIQETVERHGGTFLGRGRIGRFRVLREAAFPRTTARQMLSIAQRPSRSVPPVDPKRTGGRGL
jgi:hypothetical protein